MKTTLNISSLRWRICLALLAATLLTAGCKEQYLTGYYTQAEFAEKCEWKEVVKEKYKPNEKWMDSLATIQEKADVRLFLGTYCPDSRRLVPRFLKLLPDLPVENLEIISVDTTKKDERGLALSTGLEKIPTFIFYKDEKEVGRIVEKSKGRLEKRIFLILKNM